MKHFKTLLAGTAVAMSLAISTSARAEDDIRLRLKQHLLLWVLRLDD